MIVVPDIGTSWLLERLRTVFNAGPLKLNLYQNDYFPTLTSVLGDFTDATYPGYVRQSIDFNQPVAFDAQGHGFLLGAGLTFMSNGAPTPDQRIFGYYITNAAGDTVVWAERFPKRVWIRKAGVSITLFPRFGALTEFSG